MNRLKRWWKALFSKPEKSVSKRLHARESCPRCGRMIAKTKKGFYGHKCKPAQIEPLIYNTITTACISDLPESVKVKNP